MGARDGVHAELATDLHLVCAQVREPCDEVLLAVVKFGQANLRAGFLGLEVQREIGAHDRLQLLGPANSRIALRRWSVR